MDFIRKSAQAASKLGNKILEAVEDQNSFGASPAGSGHDLEVDVGVRRAKALTASLKNVAVRAQAWISSLKQNGTNAVALAQAAVEGAKDEFGDDTNWSHSADCLHQVLMEVDSKFTAQLCSLLQRDVVDPITRELEHNSQVKSAIEEIKQGISAGGDKLDTILARRRQLLATAVAALVSHQSNYHTRLGAQFTPLQPHVQANKAALANFQTQGSGRSVSPERVENNEPRPAPPAEVKKQAEPPPADVAPAKPPPAVPAPKEKPAAPPAEADLLNFTSAPPAAAPVEQKKSAEADLLGFDTPAQAAPQARPVTPERNTGDLLDGLSGSPVPQKTKQPEADLLGGLWESASSKPAGGGGSGASATTMNTLKQQQPDIFSDFAPSKPPATASSNNDPFSDWMGGPPKAAQKDSFLNLFDPMAGGGGGGGGAAAAAATGSIRVNGDDEGNYSPSGEGSPNRNVVRKRVNQPSAFQGSGTDREALKQQFNEHVQKKADEAAEAVRQREAEKQQYDDLKWQLADSVDAKIVAWAGPKHNRKNLRAMLSTFQSVIFEEAKEKWKPVGLHEIVLPDQVKKFHRKAILLVHPDKVQRASMESKLIAEQVHAVLHEALETFRKTEAC